MILVDTGPLVAAANRRDTEGLAGAGERVEGLGDGLFISLSHAGSLARLPYVVGADGGRAFEKPAGFRWGGPRRTILFPPAGAKAPTMPEPPV